MHWAYSCCRDPPVCTSGRIIGGSSVPGADGSCWRQLQGHKTVRSMARKAARLVGTRIGWIQYGAQKTTKGRHPMKHITLVSLCLALGVTLLTPSLSHAEVSCTRGG